MQRRTLITGLLSSAALGQSLLAKDRARPLAKNVRRKGSVKKLVVVFLRGGNDTLNTLVPIEASQYSRYSTLRPTLKLDQSALLSLTGNTFFGLHPSMQPLQSIFNAGHLCYINCVGYPNPDRSHFESEAFFETATPGNTLLDGWLNRLLANTSGPGLIRGVCVGSQLPQSLLGGYSVPVSDNFGGILVEDDHEGPGRDALEEVLNLSPTAGNEALYTCGQSIFQMVDNFSTRDLSTYTPENSANYYNSTIGTRLKHAAQMLKETPTELNIELAVVDTGGYDTHAQQVDPLNTASTTFGHGGLLLDLARGLKAFYTDMGPTRMADIALLVLSEFGRRAYQNDSAGTDHGTGGLAMVISHGINTRVIGGGASWPGLAPGQLYEGDDLAWVYDFRDIYGEVLAQHLGLSSGVVNAVLNGYSPSPIGIY
jgi:uncharacterized protein (DUF1501 family)